LTPVTQLVVALAFLPATCTPGAAVTGVNRIALLV
jgi:hypothetical protein